MNSLLATSPSSAIGDIEVVLPLGAISRFLPMASNHLVVLAHSTLITLPEAGRFPPHLPHSLREAHLIHPRNAPRVIGEHGIVGGRVIPANEPESMGGFGDLSPMRSARKAPSCTHSIKTGPPFTLSDGRGRKAALESSISQSPTNPSRGGEFRVWLRRRRLCLNMGGVICHRVFSFPFSERRSQSYFTTRNERWVAPGVSSVRICSRWIGFEPR